MGIVHGGDTQQGQPRDDVSQSSPGLLLCLLLGVFACFAFLCFSQRSDKKGLKRMQA